MIPRSAITAALESGLPLFPVKLDKSPAVRGWNMACPEQRAEWALTEPWPAMGLALDNRVVVDVDARELPGALNRANIPAGTLMRTKRGVHHHYALPEGVEGRQRIRWREQIDIKAGPSAYTLIATSGCSLPRTSFTTPARSFPCRAP